MSSLPQTGALTELRYAPPLKTKHLVAMLTSTNQELPPVCRVDLEVSRGEPMTLRQKIGADLVAKLDRARDRLNAGGQEERRR
jgi:hypothetical protein